MPALTALAGLAVALGLAVGGGGGGAERAVAQQFADLWARGDYDGMYRLLSDRARDAVAFDDFRAAYATAAATATTRSLAVGEAGDRRDGAVPVPVTVRTRIFGDVRGVLRIPVEAGDERRPAVAWDRSLVFPGLRRGEQLERETRLAPRAALQARDGRTLAAGPDRPAELPDVAAHVVGRVEPAPPEQRTALRALGYPDGAPVGVSGLERVFERTLAGTPGGTLLAGRRTLARRPPRPGRDVRTTIDPDVTRAAIAQLGDHYGGIAVVDPADGAVLALAGVAYSGLQQPGSTFKIITLVGALEAGIARPGSTYDVVDHATLSGVSIQNANGELCGGTLVAAFAHSCNSVFAPLGAQLGAQRLVAVAERFGFNRPLPIPGAAVSTVPRPEEMADDLAVGSNAIGQGGVQATALQMALVAAAIANDGRLPAPTLSLAARPSATRATTPRVARQVASMMRAVVEEGTGTAARIDGVAVAGKTGTAELRSTVAPADGELPAHLTDDIPDTDAWFVAFAPARRARVAVGVLFAEAGAGGEVAAPAAREVLVAALRRDGDGR